MTRTWTRRAHLMLAICLALTFFADTGGGARAAADPADIRQTEAYFHRLASLKIVSPLQLAIWEADILLCMDKFKPDELNDPKVINGRAATQINICFGRTLPPVLLGARYAQYLITGVWATIDFNQGSQQRHLGSIEIDNNNKGRLVSNEAGYAELRFSFDEGYDVVSIFGPNVKAYTFDYIHYNSTGRNDAGYGVLIQTEDGCKMYGRFYSDTDPNTLGTLVLARC